MTAVPGPGARRRGRPVTTTMLLLALAAIPVASGGLRLAQLSGGVQVLPADPRFTVAPAAVVLHVVATAVFALAGAAQFLPGLRRGGRSAHRRVGRVVAAAGLLVVASALWLTLTYPLKPGTGEVLRLGRLVVAPAMAAFLVLGVLAIRRRDVAAHRAWMIRAYALGLGAGTQVLTQGLGGAVLGTGVTASDLELVAGWVVNVLVAEHVVRRRPRRARRFPAARLEEALR